MDYKDFTLEMVRGKNIVATFDLHCLLTKYALDHHGIERARIYKIPLSLDRYTDWNDRDLDRIKKWTPKTLTPSR